jgi:hypothetical protein
LVFYKNLFSECCRESIWQWERRVLNKYDIVTSRLPDDWNKVKCGDAPSSLKQMKLGLAIGTRTELHVPRMSLSSCIRAYITRSTMDAEIVDESQRLNHFPVSPICTINWYLDGSGTQSSRAAPHRIQRSAYGTFCIP